MQSTLRSDTKNYLLQAQAVPCPVALLQVMNTLQKDTISSAAPLPSAKSVRIRKIRYLGVQLVVCSDVFVVLNPAEPNAAPAAEDVSHILYVEPRTGDQVSVLPNTLPAHWPTTQEDSVILSQKGRLVLAAKDLGWMTWQHPMNALPLQQLLGSSFMCAPHRRPRAERVPKGKRARASKPVTEKTAEELALRGARSKAARADTLALNMKAAATTAADSLSVLTRSDAIVLIGAYSLLLVAAIASQPILAVAAVLALILLSAKAWSVLASSAIAVVRSTPTAADDEADGIDTVRTSDNHSYYHRLQATAVSEFDRLTKEWAAYQLEPHRSEESTKFEAAYSNAAVVRQELDTRTFYPKDDTRLLDAVFDASQEWEKLRKPDRADVSL